MRRPRMRSSGRPARRAPSFSAARPCGHRPTRRQIHALRVPLALDDHRFWMVVLDNSKDWPNRPSLTNCLPTLRLAFDTRCGPSVFRRGVARKRAAARASGIRSAHRGPSREIGGLAMIMIGIDPHKRTHTAVAIDTAERVLDERLVRATSKQVPELLEWVKRLDAGDRIWAIESAGGLGYLLAQQLLAAGEDVVHPRHARVAGAGLGHRPLRQERPERRRLRSRRSAPRSWSRCGSRTTPRCSGWCRAGTPVGLVLQQDRMPSSRADGGPGAGRDQQRSLS
jgi:Transposase